MTDEHVHYLEGESGFPSNGVVGVAHEAIEAQFVRQVGPPRKPLRVPVFVAREIRRFDFSTAYPLNPFEAHRGVCRTTRVGEPDGVSTKGLMAVQDAVPGVGGVGC